MKKIYFSLLIFFSFIFFITCIITFVIYSDASFTTSPTDYFCNLTWPLEHHFTISSPFGFRISPITGASSYHLGIDIPAPENTPIYSASSGTVIYLGFHGANGYTIIIENHNILFTYSHLSPDFIIKIGDTITPNQPIAQVGPTIISPIPNNPYLDSSGNQTNGATTGSHLHFGIKIDGKAIDPINLFHSITYHPQNCPSLAQLCFYNLDT